MKAPREAPIAVPWLGILLADWPLVPLRYLVRFLSGGTPDKGNADFWTGGMIPWVSPKDMKIDRINDSEDHITEAALDGSATQLVPVGSVLVVVRGMILVHTLPVAVTTGPVTINQDIKALVCGELILPEFLHAVLAGQAEWILSQADSSAHGTKKLETEVLQRFEVPCPPLDLQRRVVATVRAQAMDLDKVVAAKQRVLDLLAEKREAITASAVTRGLDPTVKLRDSGVPWLGEIPAHWVVSRLKFEAMQIVDCLHATPPYDTDGEFPAIRTADVEPGRLLLQQARRLRIEDYRRWTERLVPIEGDILYTREGERFGIAANVPADVQLCISQRMMLFRIRPDRDSTYFMWQLNSPNVYQQASEDQLGTAAPHVNVEKIQNFWLVVPPLHEQQAIVAHITRETAKLDAVRAATERTISLLKERRAALIAAAVTGRLDLEAAA